MAPPGEVPEPWGLPVLGPRRSALGWGSACLSGPGGAIAPKLSAVSRTLGVSGAAGPAGARPLRMVSGRLLEGRLVYLPPAGVRTQEGRSGRTPGTPARPSRGSPTSSPFPFFPLLAVSSEAVEQVPQAWGRGAWEGTIWTYL